MTDRPVFTQEMIEAGVKMLNASISDAPRVLLDEEIVERIFGAMLDASTRALPALRPSRVVVTSIREWCYLPGPERRGIETESLW